MRDALFPYYERELHFIRQMAQAFKQNYPEEAGGIALEEGKSDDPHVERLIEAFALIAGRIHHKIDDEFPEITEAILDLLYPHFLRPVPSQAILQFRLDTAQSAVPEATVVRAGAAVHTNPKDGQVCTFRTGYDVNLWPIKVTRASISGVNRFAAPGISAEVAATLRIEMECLGGLKLSQIPIHSLRFYLKGNLPEIQTLYETLFVNTLRMTLQPATSQGGTGITLPPTSLKQVGFSANEALLPYSDLSFPGYRLVQEYFTFPEKFLFVDLTGLNQVPFDGFGSTFEINFSFSEFHDRERLTGLEQTIDANTFQLGCTPVVNLFEVIAEPVRISQTRTEYHVVPDQHRTLHTEIYSIDSVSSSDAKTGDSVQYEPFYALRHGRDEKEKLKRFWYAHRRPSFRKNDNGTEVYISLVDLEFNPATPDTEILSLRATCTNREQASQEKLMISDDFGEFQVEGAALVKARCLRKPTRAIRPPQRRGLQWRLISHLSLNHLSIVEKGRDALHEILRLYIFDDAATLRKQIAGVVEVSSGPVVSRVSHILSEAKVDNRQLAERERGAPHVAFCRGTGVTIKFDEAAYAGSSVYLFASVLEKFLGLYAAVNSFSSLTAVTSRGVLKQWPPRAGEQILL